MPKPLDPTKFFFSINMRSNQNNSEGPMDVEPVEHFDWCPPNGECTSAIARLQLGKDPMKVTNQLRR